MALLIVLTINLSLEYARFVHCHNLDCKCLIYCRFVKCNKKYYFLFLEMSYDMNEMMVF